jgi:transposase
VDPIWIEDATREFDVSRSSLQRYIARGRLTRLQKKGSLRDRKVYVDRDELAELVKSLQDETWVIERRQPDTLTAPRHPGGRPIGSKAKK